MSTFENNQWKASEALCHVCKPKTFLENNITYGSGLKTDEILSTIKNVSIPWDEIAVWCEWDEFSAHCSKHFAEAITEEGICYTFNSINDKEVFNENVLAPELIFETDEFTTRGWTLEEGYSDDDIEAYPRRAQVSGTRAGLIVTLSLPDNEFDYLCRGFTQGYKIALHLPGEIPSVAEQFFRVPLRQEVMVSVKPKMTTTSPDLISYGPEKRKCYFNDERQLKFYKTYTQNNCELECLSNFTITQCGCVKFSMPRDKKTRVCSQEEIVCYDTAELNYLSSKLLKKPENAWNGKKPGRTNCNCLLSCTSIKYEAEVSTASIDFSAALSSVGVDLNETHEAQSRLLVFFKENEFVVSHRTEFYSFLDFLANSGGLLGLFMGMSILSMVEMIYYILFRTGDAKKKQESQNLEDFKDNADGDEGLLDLKTFNSRAHGNKV